MIQKCTELINRREHSLPRLDRHVGERMKKSLQMLEGRTEFLNTVFAQKVYFLVLALLNAELNPIRHMLALVGARHIVHVSRVRVKPGGRAVTSGGLKCISLVISLHCR